MFYLHNGRKNKDVIAIAPSSYLDALDDIMPSNGSSEIDGEIHVSPLSSTNDISTFDIPSDLVVSAPIILDPLVNDQGRRYPLKIHKYLDNSRPSFNIVYPIGNFVFNHYLSKTNLAFSLYLSLVIFRRLLKILSGKLL